MSMPRRFMTKMSVILMSVGREVATLSEMAVALNPLVSVMAESPAALPAICHADRRNQQ